MFGIIIAILTGIFLSMQNAFNANLNKIMGPWETTLIVHLVGFVFSVFMVIIFGNRNFSGLNSVNKMYWFGGVMGAMVIFMVVQSIARVGTCATVSIMLVTQLFFSAVIDHFGLFSMTKIPMNTTKILGLVIMVIGLIIFGIKK